MSLGVPRLFGLFGLFGLFAVRCEICLGKQIIINEKVAKQ